MKIIILSLILSVILCSFPGIDTILPEQYIDPKDITIKLEEKINEVLETLGSKRSAEEMLQLEFILPSGEEILEDLKVLGKYEATTHANDKHFNRFWSKIETLYPNFYSYLAVDDDRVKVFDIPGWNPALSLKPHVILRAVDDEEGGSVEGESQNYCNWPWGAGPFDPEVITCDFPYFPLIHGKKYIVLRMETKLELIAMAIALHRIKTFIPGWMPQRRIVIISSRTHHKMDGGKDIVPWMDELEDDGVIIALQYMLNQGYVAESCVDEQTFALVYGYLLANTVPLYPAYPIGTSQLGIDMYRIRIKGKLNGDGPFYDPDYLNDVAQIRDALMPGGNTNLECDVENSITLKETLSEWLGIPEAYIPPEYLEAAKYDGLLRRTVCTMVIGTNIYTNNLVYYKYEETRSPYDAAGLDIIVQVGYPHESSSSETEALFRGKLQNLIIANPGKIEVDLLYKRPNRPKASKETYWYGMTENLIHDALDDVILAAFGVNITVPQFQTPGSFDLYKLGAVCENMYSFQFYTMEYTCPDMVTTFAPEVNVGIHGHGCGSMYSEDFAKNMVDGNALTFLQT